MIKKYLERKSIFVLSFCLFIWASLILFVIVNLTLHPIFNDFLINCSASFFILGITLLVLNPLIDSNKENQWKIGPRIELEKDFKFISNMSISYFLEPLGISISDYMDVNTTNFDKDSETAFNKMLKDISKDKINKLLLDLDINGWKRMISSLQIVKKDINDSLLIYQTILPKRLLTELIVLRANLKTVDFDLGFLGSIILLNDEDWKKRNEEYKNIYEVTCENMANHLNKYLISVSDFRKILIKKYADEDK